MSELTQEQFELARELVDTLTELKDATIQHNKIMEVLITSLIKKKEARD